MLLSQVVQPHIDAGQLIITAVIAIVAYLVKRMLDRIESKLDVHDEDITELKINFAKFDGQNRRHYERRAIIGDELE